MGFDSEWQLQMFPSSMLVTPRFADYILFIAQSMPFQFFNLFKEFFHEQA